MSGVKRGLEEFQYPPFQKAIPYFPDYGYQVTLVFGDTLDSKLQNTLETMIQQLNEKCKIIDGYTYPIDSKKEPLSGFNVGFELNFWKTWCDLHHVEVSKPISDAMDMMNSADNFMKKHSKLSYTEGDMWIFLKADKESDCDALLKIVKDTALPASTKIIDTKASKQNQGRVFGGRFNDGLSNAVDGISMTREVLIQPDSNGTSSEGGTFAFVQFFDIDKTVLSKSSQAVAEKIIGRESMYSEVLPHPADRCHIKRARLISEKDGSNTELIRQSLPFFKPRAPDVDRGPVQDGLFFVAFGQSAQKFSNILDNILGDPKDTFTTDLLIINVQGRNGKFFYCPNTDELPQLPKFKEKEDMYPKIPFWTKYSSKNETYFYNHIQYLSTMGTLYKPGDPPSGRILYLMSKVFALWHSTWVHKFDVPRIPHLKEFLSPEVVELVMGEPIQVRKGYSYKVMLGDVFTSDQPKDGKIYGYSENFGTYRLDAKELIVGVTERLSLGSGKEVMPYLKEGSERMLSLGLALAEDGNMGHIVPNHKYILDLGVEGMLKKLRGLKDGLEGATSDDEIDKITFYKSAIYAFEGVQEYLKRYGKLARDTIPTTVAQCDKNNLEEVAKRMDRLAANDHNTGSFHDAMQMVFTMHCCLHLCGQPVSVGRLDQLLIGYYRDDIKNKVLTEEEAQEIIDAFFIKFDEHVVLNRYNIPYGHTTYGSTAVTGRGGPFPTGDSMNQWIQQITVGGCNEKGLDACNEITLMCLKACRRLPLNSPCISLRLTADTPIEVKQAAVDALLSGGAHPILYHDKKMTTGLYQVLCASFEKSGLQIPDDLMTVARDYSCDGCYEAMFTGRTEFKFSYVFLLKAVIYTLNSGADYQPADPLHLAGGVSSYRTELPEDIQSFEKFKEIFLKHLKLMVQNTYASILSAYGNPWKICPSPLLSCLLEGCVDTGRDMTNGGSRFHILCPMYVGFANTVNSLYNVKRMIFDHNDVTTLEFLKMALINNWGENMVEPFYDTTGRGTIHTTMSAQNFHDLRDYALSLPKFGTDTANDDINSLASWLAIEMDKIAHDSLYEEGSNLDTYNSLRKKFSVEKLNQPFLFQVMTGSGTFESYVSVGAGCAATPDGRLNGQPTASDVSPQPFAQDRPVPSDVAPLDIVETLKPYNVDAFNRVINGCEVDLTIPEDFPPKALLAFINSFINGDTGSNLVSVTCIDPQTEELAMKEPQKFDLVRNRMGGWSNFFVAMFNEHQLQHMRRPMYGPAKEE